MSNDNRVRRGALALAAYADIAYPDPKSEPDETVLKDLLTDLRHFAARNLIDMSEATRMSGIHFEYEENERRSS